MFQSNLIGQRVQIKTATAGPDFLIRAAFLVTRDLYTANGILRTETVCCHVESLADGTFHQFDLLDLKVAGLGPLED